ncbi:MAG: alpha-2-macroglobulin family protein, partial [Gammaproteobacteria bacterium]
MMLATDHRLPDFVLTHPLSVLEQRAATEVPIVVTNLESLTVDYGSLTAAGPDASLTTSFSLPPAQDVAYRSPLRLRDMLGGESGVVVGSVHSQPEVDKSSHARFLFAQVTPYQVNVKAGHYNTLVWVTDFSTGKPVPNARVEMIKSTYHGLTGDTAVLGRSATDLDGAAMLAGLNELSPRLVLLNAYKRSDQRLFVRVIKNDNIALLPLDYDFRVDAYRASQYTVYLSMRPKYGHIHSWGTTAQGVYRAGDTIQYKFYVRDQDGATFVAAPREGYTLRIIDPTGKTAQEITDLTLSEFGAFHGEFTVPETAPVGWYRFQLSAKYANQTWQPMRVLVSDFVPAAFRVTTDVDGKLFQPAQRMTIDTQASLHAGGPYADAAARITAILRARPLQSAHALARGFRFDVYRYGQPTTETLFQTESAVNDQGHLETGFAVPDSPILYGRIMVESAVQDDRGKFIAGFANAEYRGRDRFVGLKTTSWVFKADEPASVDVLVIDENGKPAADTETRIVVERMETTAARVKGAGNAYLTQYSHKWVEAAGCKLTSESEPVACEFVPADPGDYRITAHIADTRGREHATELRSWVIGKGRVLWEQPADNSLTIIPEQEKYQVGDTARYLVKNPFPGAKALVTVERYGVLTHWIETFASGTPVIEFDIEESFLPGFYLSVTVMSPRVEQPLGDDGVDLGKPAMRMGYVEAEVRDSYKEIVVEIDPARDVYKPGDTVEVNLQASPRHTGKTEPIELAVAVLDEAVFDLIAQGRAYFDPYAGFYTIDGLDLDNFSLMMRLVGRQKFEKKGANAGGDGGEALDFRSVFKYVSYWNPSIEVEPGQSTQIDFEAPDNLTGWRVLAMAVTPSDRMGLGEGTFKVNRDTELRPVMPNQVIEGDRFHAGFSVMNRTDAEREITVSLNAEGAVRSGADGSASKREQTVSVPPYKRVLVWLPVTAAADGEIRFAATAATAGDELDRDALAHAVPVLKRRALQTSATYGTTTADSVTETIAFPEDMRADTGEAGLVVSPSVIGNVEGAFTYMKDYPYTCWEQKLTRGTMASHYLDLKD